LLVVTTSSPTVTLVHDSSNEQVSTFGKNGLISFICNASDFGSLWQLSLLYSDGRKKYKTVCIKNINNIWQSTGIPINTAKEIEGPDVTDEHCEIKSNEEGYAFVVNLKIAEKTLRGNFQCEAHGVGIGRVVSSEVRVLKVEDCST